MTAIDRLNRIRDSHTAIVEEREIRYTTEQGLLAREASSRYAVADARMALEYARIELEKAEIALLEYSKHFPKGD